ncbi:MAG: hypothetical protein ACE5JX_03455 [Acidobacteriota bacterium]
METKRKESRVQEAVEQGLSDVIDEWYERVSSYYVTQEALADDPGLGKDAELKRFHDEKGHLIKFNKGDLDFTYGLRSSWHGEQLAIEISVNNKVENFDYEDFQRELLGHYERAGAETVAGPRRKQRVLYRDVLQLESGIDKAFTVEKHRGKADIMRLSFRVNTALMETWVSHRETMRELIEGYCVSPFRRIYAKVYRATSW